MSDRALTRRTVLTGAGAAVAGLGLAAAPGADAATGTVAVGLSSATVVEFRGRIYQTGSAGEKFASRGFLTAVEGLTAGDLFAGPATSVDTALFSVTATGDLTARVLDRQVHALDIVGQLRVRQRSSAGLNFDRPATFGEGTLVALYDLVLQDALAVIADASGIPTLTGDMTQAGTHLLANGLQFGTKGERLRLFATGLGQLIDPVTLNAELEIVGNWSMA
jgi:hypothetical protein